MTAGQKKKLEYVTLTMRLCQKPKLPPSPSPVARRRKKRLSEFERNPHARLWVNALQTSLANLYGVSIPMVAAGMKELRKKSQIVLPVPLQIMPTIPATKMRRRSMLRAQFIEDAGV